MYPEGNIWNSAELVVSTIGPPAFTSTLICEGSGAGVSVFAGGRLQLALRKSSGANKDNILPN
jgi:hypothetical protein